MPVPLPASPAPPRAFWWQWINWLALDAVAVAVAWFYVFGGMTGVNLLRVEAVCLGAAVWVVYMADRLMDAGHGFGDEARHRFAGRHARWLVPVLILTISATTWTALHSIGWITVKAALWVAAGVLLYFGVIITARWKALSQPLLLGISSLFVLAMVQGETESSSGIQLWRAVVAGTMATVLYTGLRHQFDPPPWILTKKWLDGFLFALGVAVTPFSHVEDWGGLLHGTPVVLFAAVCALNSLGIRLWETRGSLDRELVMLNRLYPWLLVAVGLGSLAQGWVADEWARPVLWGIAGCVIGLGLLHFLRRWPVPARVFAADGVLLVGALLILWAGVPDPS